MLKTYDIVFLKEDRQFNNGEFVDTNEPLSVIYTDEDGIVVRPSDPDRGFYFPLYEGEWRVNDAVTAQA